MEGETAARTKETRRLGTVRVVKKTLIEAKTPPFLHAIGSGASLCEVQTPVTRTNRKGYAIRSVLIRMFG